MYNVYICDYFILDANCLQNIYRKKLDDAHAANVGLQLKLCKIQTAIEKVKDELNDLYQAMLRTKLMKAKLSSEKANKTNKNLYKILTPDQCYLLVNHKEIHKKKYNCRYSEETKRRSKILLEKCGKISYLTLQKHGFPLPSEKHGKRIFEVQNVAPDEQAETIEQNNLEQNQDKLDAATIEQNNFEQNQDKLDAATLSNEKFFNLNFQNINEQFFSE